MAEADVIDGGGLALRKLQSLGRLCSSDERVDVCGYLRDRIQASDETLFGMDFPFGLPIELGLVSWSKQLSHVKDFVGNAKDFGRALVAMSERLSGKMHIRRSTDRETQTPFDCYHYRIIYQTFHGMRDVLAPVVRERATAVLPFHYARLQNCRRVIVEACPSSTLKRLGLPHQRYKQSGGKPPDVVHQKSRQIILKGIENEVSLTPYQRRVIMTNPGGDALDAVLAAIGSWHAYRTADHREIAQHDRYPIEGRVYC